MIVIGRESWGWRRVGIWVSIVVEDDGPALIDQWRQQWPALLHLINAGGDCNEFGVIVERFIDYSW